eukprot:502322-Amphidinium_carterae.1
MGSVAIYVSTGMKLMMEVPRAQQAEIIKEVMRPQIVTPGRPMDWQQKMKFESVLWVWFYPPLEGD